MPRISDRTRKLTGSPIRRLTPFAVEAKSKGRTVYHLNIGQPDIPTPTSFMDGVRNVPIDVLAYSPSLGIAETVNAFLAYYEERGIALEAKDLCITVGGSESFEFALQTVANPGDEILVPEPFYPNYMGKAVMSGLTVVPITTKAEDGFHLPPIAETEAKVTPRTRAVLFSNPANPTGVSYTRDELQQLADLALKHDLYVISDEPYRELVYEGEATSVLSFPELAEHAILVDSISKRISACGARIGVLASRNQDVMASVNKLAQIRLSPPSFSQYGFVSFMNDAGHGATIQQMVEKFHRRRDTLFDALQTLPNVVCRKPEGAFYIFVKLPELDDSEVFAKWLLTDFEQNGDTVMIAPGAGFYATPGVGNDEFRVAYVLEEEKLVRAVEVLKAGFEAYLAR